VRKHLEQQIGVTGLRGQHDATPELVDADRAHPRVLGVVHLLQVQAGVGGGGELAEHLADLVLDGLLQLAELEEEVLVDEQLRHAAPYVTSSVTMPSTCASSSCGGSVRSRAWQTISVPA